MSFVDKICNGLAIMLIQVHHQGQQQQQRCSPSPAGAAPCAYFR
eukprot:COSAG01_NODE_6235_length_3776_cov_48.658961_4_plen_44_part_00